MTTPKKFLWIGLGVTLTALVSVCLIVGPLQVLRIVYFSISNDTEYAPGYSSKKFKQVKIGNAESDVLKLLGKPIKERSAVGYTYLLYAPRSVPEFEQTGDFTGSVDYTMILLDLDGKLTDIYGQKYLGSTSSGAFSNIQVTMRLGDGENYLGIKKTDIDALKAANADRAAIEAKYGKPVGEFTSEVTRWLHYSRSPSSSDYLLRRIGLDDSGKVSRILSEQYMD